MGQPQPELPIPYMNVIIPLPQPIPLLMVHVVFCAGKILLQKLNTDAQ